MVELGLLRAAMAKLLRWQINLLLLVVVARGLLERRIFCLCCFFSGGREGVCCFHGERAPLGFGDGSVSSYLLVFCERVGAWGIPMGGWLVWVVELLGDSGLFFSSLVLGLANADFFFLFCSAKVKAVMMCLVVLRALVPAALPTGAPNG